VLLLSVGLPLLAWRLTMVAPQSQVQRQASALNPARPAYTLVRSQALPASMVFSTRPESIPTLSSSQGMVAYVETGTQGHLFREVTDDQLLALFHGQTVALVRAAPDQAELLFLEEKPKHAAPE
jgi:hypothetical protein